jgi:signal transduction histidine kinase
MIQQIDTLTRIANAFADFASLNAQNLEKICINSEVSRIINLFKNNNVKLISSIKSEDSINVFIDKSHLTRILNNLIKNSIQAARINTPIEVIVEMKAEKNNYIISVKDNGTGIPIEIQDKVFEPNFTTKNSGMGLGLAMVKKIIDDFQGAITYSTSPNGTVFEISIPIKNK